MFDQLSLVWQVWAYMLLGAILLGGGVLVGIEWAFLACCARAAWRSCRRTFTADGDEIDREVGQSRECCRRFVSPHPHEAIRSTARDADEILILSRGRAFTFRSSDVPAKTVIRFGATPHADDALRRRQLLALAESSPARRTVH